MIVFTVERFPDGVRATRSSDQNCITRKCLLESMPFDLEVTVESRRHYESPCECILVYRATPESIEWLRGQEMLKRGVSTVCVCSCMGRIRSKNIEDIAA